MLNSARLSREFDAMAFRPAVMNVAALAVMLTCSILTMKLALDALQTPPSCWSVMPGTAAPERCSW